MQKKEEKKQIYEVWLIRHNDEPISALSTDVYDKAYEKWKELTDAWVNAINNKTPFILTSPIVTAFDPGAVKEITVRPVMAVTESKYDNPYQQRMMKDGLTKTMNNMGNIINSDLLDEGYKS